MYRYIYTYIHIEFHRVSNKHICFCFKGGGGEFIVVNKLIGMGLIGATE